MENRIVKDLIQEIEAKDSLIESIYNLLEVITKASDLSYIYDKILEIAIYTIKEANFGSLLVLNENNIYEFTCMYGYDINKFKDIKLKPEETSLYRETNGLMNKTCIFKEIFKYNDEFFNSVNVLKIQSISKIDIKTTISVPIRFDDRVIAILNLDSTKEMAFNENDKRNLELFAMETSNFIKIKHLLDVQEYINNHDELTGVYNKRYNKKIVIDKINNNEPFEMIVIDLDNLKRINDNFGHIFGDFYIKEFAQTVYTIVKKYGVFSRFGGDEFNIIVSKNSVEILREVESEIKKKSVINKLDIQYSYGIASFPKDGDSYDELFRVADGRMYEIKNKKKNFKD